MGYYSILTRNRHTVVICRDHAGRGPVQIDLLEEFPPLENLGSRLLLHYMWVAGELPSSWLDGEYVYEERIHDNVGNSASHIDYLFTADLEALDRDPRKGHDDRIRENGSGEPCESLEGPRQ